MHKRVHVARAGVLLESGDDEKLAYAALELRMAIEAIVYEKLRLYAPRLPSEVLEKWQPPQAVRALLEFEPLATENKIIRFAREDYPGGPTGEWRTLGAHRSFKLPWLRQAYNRLGNLLHLPSPRSAAKHEAPGWAQKVRSDLEAIFDEVRAVSESQIDSTLARTVTFECAACDSPVICNEEALRKSGLAICQHDSCRAHHTVTFGSDESIVFHLKAAEFECMTCDARIPVETRKLALNVRFACSNCRAEYTIAEVQWGYALTTDEGQSGTKQPP